jgi:hypothetical protein
VVGSGAAVVMALSGGLGVAVWEYRQAVEQARIAREEAQTSKAVQGFMEDIFRANSTDNPDPEKARKTTAEELLDIAGKKAESAMADAPRARLEMLRLLTKMNDEIGLPEKAVATARAAVQLTNAPGMPMKERVDGLFGLSAVLAHAGRLAEGHDMLDSIAKIYEDERVVDPIAIARLDSERAASSLMRGNAEEAADFADRALRRLRLASSPVDGLLMEALFLRANALHGDPKRASEVRTLALEAQEVYDRIKGTPEGQGFRHFQAQLAMEMTIAALNLDRFVEAEKYARLTFRLALQMGEVDQASAKQFSAVMVPGLVAASKPLEAASLIETALGPYHVSTVTAENAVTYSQWSSAYASALVAAGRAESAKSIVTETRKALVGISAAPVSWIRQVDLLLARCQIELGMLQEAEADLTRAEQAEAPGRRVPGLIFRTRAQLSLARGQGAPASDAVGKWRASRFPPFGVREELVAQSLVAEGALVDGRWRPAADLADESLKQIAGFSERPALADIEARALLIRGRALLGQGEARDATPALLRSVSLFEGVVDPAVSLQLAHALGALARAQVRTGHAAQARETFRRMKAIYAQHPNLGPPLRAELASVAREVSARS